MISSPTAETHWARLAYRIELVNSNFSWFKPDLESLPAEKQQEALDSFNQMIERLAAVKAKVEVTKPIADNFSKVSMEERNWQKMLSDLRRMQRDVLSIRPQYLKQIKNLPKSQHEDIMHWLNESLDRLTKMRERLLATYTAKG